MGYATLDDVPLRVTSITEDSQIKSTSKYLQGANGSYTKRIGMGGRLITVPVLADETEIQRIKDLRKKAGPLILISESQGKYDGEYHIIGFQQVEDRKQHFQVTITLQEHVVFNVTRMDFTSFEITKDNTGREVDVKELWEVQ